MLVLGDHVSDDAALLTCPLWVHTPVLDSLRSTFDLPEPGLFVDARSVRFPRILENAGIRGPTVYIGSST